MTSRLVLFASLSILLSAPGAARAFVTQPHTTTCHRQPTSRWPSFLQENQRQKRIVISSSSSSSSSTGADITSSLSLPASALPSIKNENENKKKERVAVLVCPAQFCVPKDYGIFFQNLANLGDELDVEIASSSSTVPLSRTDWIKVARQLPTMEFLEARLNVPKTLSWYFEAIEQGLSNIFAAEGGNIQVCLVGHSIGGWVARAYLGGMSCSSSAVHRLALRQCSSFITLGTPHVAPERAWVDQTRGLIRAIDETPSCSPQALVENLGISITCVCSEGIRGGLSLSSLTNVENLIATGSYLPLTGEFSGDSLNGDGIVPSSLAFLPDPAARVILNKCSRTGEAIRHCHVVPTPWNLWDGSAPSIALPADDYPSYISNGVVEQWARFIR